MKHFTTALAAFSTLAALALADDQPEGVPIHLSPQEDAVIVGYSPPGHPLALAPLPPEGSPFRIPDDWVAIFHKGKFELYVRNEDVTKDMQIPVGTQLFLRGERGAPPFTRVEEDDEPELLRIGPGWSTVYLEKMGVGFVRRADLGLPSGRTERPPAQIPQGARQSDPPPPRPEPLRQVETVRTPPAPDAPADPRSSEAIPRRLEGIVEEVRRHPFRQPLYPYHLVDQRGRRLAYLDLQALLPTTPPESFLGRWVSVRGLLNTEGDRNERVLRVESMRFLP